MKKSWAIWFVIWVISIVGISNYGGVISYGFFYLVTSVPIVSLLYLIYVYLSFRIYQKLESRVLVVNQPVPFLFSLLNEFPIAFVGVRVRFFTSFSTINGLNDDVEYELMPGTEITKETMLVCKYRGDYEVGIKKVEIQDYFRLFRFSYHNSETKHVIVKPALVPIEQFCTVDVSNSLNDSKDNPSTLDLLSREYVIGDDIRAINWNLTAATGKIMTRQMVGEGQQGVSIIMDTMRQETDDKIFIPVENKILELTLAISLYMAKHGIMTKEYHLENELSVNIIHQLADFDELYEKISAVSFHHSKIQERLFMNLAGERGLYASHVVFMVLKEWTTYAADLANQLKNYNVEVVVYLVEFAGVNGKRFYEESKIHFIGIDPDDDLREVL